MVRESFYDPERTYYENYELGPFGAFADETTVAFAFPPRATLHGHPVQLPFGIPAGPLLNGAYVTAALRKGFDVPIYKTVRSGIHESHAYPNVVPIDVTGDLSLAAAESGVTSKDAYTDPLSITNSFGVPSFAPDTWQPDVAAAVAAAGAQQLVGLSFQGTKWPGASSADYLADWVTTARLAAETGADFLEANLSCPNEGTTALLCFDVQRVVEIASAIKEAIGDTPLWLKVSYFTDDALLDEFVREVGGIIDGLATINTISAVVRTPGGEQALPGEGRLRSGVCGHSIRWAGVEMVERLAAWRATHQHTFTIIGVGGVTAPADYHTYRAAGADVVMSATGAMWNPLLAAELKETITGAVSD